MAAVASRTASPNCHGWWSWARRRRRWARRGSIEGAQAILWLRTSRANGDLDAYWNWHITQERQRNHLSRYKDGRILAA